MPSVDLARILEATYAVEAPERAWLEGLVDALRPALEDGLGMAAYTYDASVRPLAIRETILDCPLDANGLSALMSGSNESYVRSSWLAKVAATASETPGFSEHPGDVLVIHALDPVGIGCLVGAPLRKLRKLNDRDRDRWERVGAHIQTALRLRLRLGAQSPPRNDNGTSGGVDAKGAEGALKEAVLGIDRVRRKLRREPDRALASWHALVRARWTLVHDFEAGNDRYIVARANKASATGPQLLSEREREVVGCLAMGHSQKVIAYELGISHSTVRVLIGRARAKLGAPTLAELIEKLRGAG